MNQTIRNLLLLFPSGGLLPFSDGFNRGNGPLGGLWTGGTWAISSNKATNTPTEGANLCTYGDMEAGDPPTGWGGHDGAVLDGVPDERTGGGGIQSLDVARGGANTFAASHTSPNAVINQWYRMGGWIRNVDASWGYLNVYGYSRSVSPAGVVGTAWAEQHMTFCPDQTYMRPAVYVYSVGANGTSARGDDVVWKQLTLSTLFATLDARRADVRAQADLTIVRAAPAGLVLNLDDIGTPQNFIIGFHDGQYARLWKCVAGTYTSVIGAAAAYAAGATLEVRKSGTSYSLYYNGVQVGTTSTVSDAGIINNTVHGLFATYINSTHDNYLLQRN